MTPPRKRGRPTAVPPSEVLERAVRLFCEEGIDRLSLNEVCSRLGISKPALYRSFGGEDGLRQASLAYYFDKWMTPHFAEMDYNQPFKAQCEQLADLVCHRDPKTPPAAGCLFTKMRLSSHTMGPDALQSVRTFETGTLANLTEWMKRISAAGMLKKELAPADAAEYIDAQIKLAALDLSQGDRPDAVAARLTLALSALWV